MYVVFDAQDHPIMRVNTQEEAEYWLLCIPGGSWELIPVYGGLTDEQLKDFHQRHPQCGVMI